MRTTTIILSLVILSTVGISGTAHAQQVPDWVHDVIILWLSGDVTDIEFINAMYFVFDKTGLLSSDIMAMMPGMKDMDNTNKADDIDDNTSDNMEDNSMDDVNIDVMIDDETGQDFKETTREIIEPININDINDINDTKTTSIDMDSIECKGFGKCIKGTITGYIDAFSPKIKSNLVRLSIATSPEIIEPGGQIALDYVESICPVGSTAIVDEDDGQIGNLGGRVIGLVYCNGVNLNEALGTSGYGSMWTKFCKQSEFAREPWAWDNGCSEALKR